MALTLKESRGVIAGLLNKDFSSVTPNEAIEIAQSFATVIDFMVTATSLATNGYELDAAGKPVLKMISTKQAADLVASTGLVKNILALRNNKKPITEKNVISFLSRIALGRLQNVGDTFDIDHDNFTITLRVVDNIKINYDAEGIGNEAGLSVTREIINPDLAGCFKEAVAAINPTGCNQAILDGKLDAKYKTTNKSFDVLIEFAYKEKEDN